MSREGIQSADLANIRCNVGDKKSLVKENKLDQLYGNKYKILLDHEILKDHGVFIQELYIADELVSEIRLAPASNVVVGPI